MIDVGIIGGAGEQAGELIRILINHPDVRLDQIYEPDLAGRDVRAIHHGLIGETALTFTDKINLDKLDVLFVVKSAPGFPQTEDAIAGNTELCIIELQTIFQEARHADSLAVYGVPEVNRKALVRGARHAVIPPAVEALSSIALMPLAMRSMIPERIEILVEAQPLLTEESKIDTINVENTLKLCGNQNPVSILYKYKSDKAARAMRLTFQIHLPLPLDNIMDLYEEVYDDHNLTHVVSESVDEKEVEGTDKCVISLDKTPSGLLQVQIVADARMRGGAGDAVHVMNLLMGLYEKTGLALKASSF